MKVEEYRELTNCLFDALRNYESSASDRERAYSLAVISQVAYEASIARCSEAQLPDLEQMDFALKLVLDIIKEKPIPDCSTHELQAALH